MLEDLHTCLVTIDRLATKLLASAINRSEKHITPIYMKVNLGKNLEKLESDFIIKNK